MEGEWDVGVACIAGELVGEVVELLVGGVEQQLNCWWKGLDCWQEWLDRLWKSGQ